MKKFFVRVNSMIGLVPVITSMMEPDMGIQLLSIITSVNGVKSGCKVFTRILGGVLMAGEKNFETRLKKWLESEGIYPLGEPVDRMSAPPCGYWEKRWGGGRYVKSGLPDMKIVVKGITLEVELKATNGTPSELQKRNLAQINNSGCFGFILYPEGFETFKKIVKGVKQCEFPTAGLISLINAHTDTACDMWKG